MNDVILACRNLSMQYQQGSEKITVFSGLEMEVHRGELIGIVGASGSGKTTLLNLLGGLDIPTGGEVLLDGISSAKLSENDKAALRNRSLGFVYQFHHLLPEFTALENVAIPKFIARVPKKQALAEAAAILEQVGLGARLHHKPAALSGGERQRVAVARALVMQPACVLMDEPTGNLDVETAESIQALLLELNRTLGIAFVVVTHDLTLANRMGRVLAMQHGKLVERNA